MYVCMYACVCIDVCLYICTYVRMYVYLWMCVCLCCVNLVPVSSTKLGGLLKHLFSLLFLLYFQVLNLLSFKHAVRVRLSFLYFDITGVMAVY